MALDSVAAFEERIRELRLQDHLERFRGRGWTTFGTFAFAADYTPGHGDPAKFTEEVVVPALGSAEHADRYVLRRLFFEAYTLVAADLRRRVEATEDDAPRRMPTSEREARRSRLAARLAGLSLEGELDPSFHLQDLAYDMY